VFRPSDSGGNERFYCRGWIIARIATPGEARRTITLKEIDCHPRGRDGTCE